MALGLEATCYVAIANLRLVEPVRRRADSYQEQTAHIARLIALDPPRG